MPGCCDKVEKAPRPAMMAPPVPRMTTDTYRGWGGSVGREQQHNPHSLPLFTCKSDMQ